MQKRKSKYIHRDQMGGVKTPLTMRCRLKDMERRFQEEQEVLSVTAKQLASQYADAQKELLPMIETLKQLVIGEEHIPQ